MRGFIDPARATRQRPLWHYDLASGEWSEKSPGEIGWDWGFYDYADEDTELEHPDLTFEKFEREFPLIREHMLQRKFKGWAKQRKAFLLSYMQMMRARSPMFIEAQTEHNRGLRAATITSVGPGNQITVDSMELRPLPENVVRNATISQMRQEIAKGPDWMWDFNWALRYTNAPADSFVTGPQPVITEGKVEGRGFVDAMKHPDTLIWFPLCWQACLVGSIRRFDEGTLEAPPSLLAHVRGLFRRSTSGFLISPHKLSDQAFT
jgi:hypothetical protein